jgi:cytidylate kinase
MSAAPSPRVVTISREYGSGGAAVAAILATRLGFQLLDRALILKIAGAAGVAPGVAEAFDERVDPWLHRLGRALWRGGIEGVAPLDESRIVDADRLAALSGRIIDEAGRLGDCVIVGRGSACVLRGRPDCLHVFVYAPRDLRAFRLRARLGPDADVEAAMDTTDRERAAYFRRHFDADWKDPLLYDLMVNAALGHEAAARAVLAAVESGRTA